MKALETRGTSSLISPPRAFAFNYLTSRALLPRSLQQQKLKGE
jgi:hypothetical protein